MQSSQAPVSPSFRAGMYMMCLLVCVSVYMQHRVAEAKAAVRRLVDASLVDAAMASMDAEVSADVAMQHHKLVDVLRQPISRAQLHVGVTLQVSILVCMYPCHRNP